MAYDPQQIQRRSAGMLYGNAQYANPMYRRALGSLFRRSHLTGKTTGQIARPMDALNDQYQQATGQLDRSLASRGLTDSSAMASGLGALAAGRATGAAQLVTGARNENRARQDALRAMALQALQGGVMGGAQGAASIAGQDRGQTLQEEQFEFQKDQANSGLFGDIMGGLGAAAGAYFGGGLGGGFGGLFGGKRPGGMMNPYDYSQLDIFNRTG